MFTGGSGNPRATFSYKSGGSPQSSRRRVCTSLNGADTAIVAPVYAAGESPIDGISRDTLAEGLRAHGHKRVLTIDGPDDLPALIGDLAKPGGAVVFLGAGSITGWAYGIEAALKEKGGAG